MKYLAVVTCRGLFAGPSTLEVEGENDTEAQEKVLQIFIPSAKARIEKMWEVVREVPISGID